MTNELALFPLNAVLFPAGPVALRVFEPRYLDMIARVLRGENRFGVIAIRRGAEVGAAETFEVGTTAEIVDWHQEKGLLGIRALGRDSFRLQATTRQPDGLYVGRVTLLEPLASQPLPEAYLPLAKLLRSLLEPLLIYRDIPAAYADSVWVGSRLAEVLPLAIEAKQALLETQDALARLERLAVSLRSGQANA